ncbi:hypothetical protein HPP92_016703 [Vanilla planifolia]|uniref:Macrophage erythroblast attacher n=1 Tax=Vanilla planifolia TaxID=51239 RepID=A0A835UQC3_VANPL|nr:hypothetical protein HPP92_016703 [Vanilla planifolia]
MSAEAASNGDASLAPTATSAPTPAAVSPTPMILGQAVESIKLEHQFLRVPFEHFKKTIRANHRCAEKEVAAVLSGVTEAANRQDISREEAFNHLSSLVSRLQGLKRKLEDGSAAEDLQAQRCRARLEHLEGLSVDNMVEWNNTRLKRILVDYMLRMSYYDSATMLAETSNIQDLVDMDVFIEAKNVIISLQNREVGPALAWCSENKSRLKKFKSKFEFLLRHQEFIELVRVDESLKAIAYARKFLAPWAPTHMKELQRAMATLAFKSNTECATYSVLFGSKQWDYLVDQFKQDFYKLFGMTAEPLLNIYLQAGLSALKTPFCYEESCPKEDPLSQENYRKLAEPLPFSKQHNSKLVCYITREVMDSENPPLVLPNGYVYSTKALEEMAKKNNGSITCPRTGYVCSYTDLVKAYIS